MAKREKSVDRPQFFFAAVPLLHFAYKICDPFVRATLLMVACVCVLYGYPRHSQYNVMQRNFNLKRSLFFSSLYSSKSQAKQFLIVTILNWYRWFMHIISTRSNYEQGTHTHTQFIWHITVHRIITLFVNNYCVLCAICAQIHDESIVKA